MSHDLSDYETQGARARPERRDDNRSAPPTLQAMTRAGVALLVVALVVLAYPVLEPHGSNMNLLPKHIGEFAATLATIAAATGILVLAIRAATGVLLHAIEAR